MGFQNKSQSLIQPIVFGLLFLFSIQLIGQEDPRIHRAGLRASYKSDDVDMWGGEFSYQVRLKGIRRLEIGLGSMSSSSWSIFQTTFIYQWQLIRAGGFSFYTGPGAGFGYADYGYGDGNFYGVLAANVGVDYTFKFPLQIAVDYRPEYSAWQDVGKEVTNQVAFALRLAF